MDYNITKQSYETNSDIFIQQWKDSNETDKGKIETFISMIAENAKILDVGAGFGKDVHYFNNRGFDCLGIDFCDEFIAKSKLLYDNVNIIKMSFHDIDFPDDTFDALWARGSLFHISKTDFKIVINRLSEVLKKGGTFYIQMISNCEIKK